MADRNSIRQLTKMSKIPSIAEMTGVKRITVKRALTLCIHIQKASHSSLACDRRHCPARWHIIFNGVIHQEAG